MCGIVGAVAEKDVVPILVEGLKRLEYRGYDSAGVAVVGADNTLGLSRTVGKVAELEEKLARNPLQTTMDSEGLRQAGGMMIPAGAKIEMGD